MVGSLPWFLRHFNIRGQSCVRCYDRPSCKANSGIGPVRPKMMRSPAISDGACRKILLYDLAVLQSDNPQRLVLNRSFDDNLLPVFDRREFVR